MVDMKAYHLKDGQEITGYLLSNDAGMRVEILNLGAIIRSIEVPDKEGNLENVVLQFEDINDYRENPGYIGAVIGRVAGRVGGSEIVVEGSVYPLSANEGTTHLHGGYRGIDKKIWEEVARCDGEDAQLTLRTSCEHLEEGYPGHITVEVTYTLSAQNILTLTYRGTTDQITVVNLTNHTYFNLSGNLKRTITEHHVRIDSQCVAMIDQGGVVTGNYLSVEGTPFDLKERRLLARGLESNHEQIAIGNGYDHPWILEENQGCPQISYYDPVSKRQLEITTNQEAVVMYTMNYAIDAPLRNNPFSKSERRLGVCFETQKLPIGEGMLNGEGILLRPNELYQQETVWKFTIET
ncbi:MAG: aldose epimerase family protein [Cellulosilyticaceae bacterium]